MGERGRKPARTSSAIVRQVFDAVDASGLLAGDIARKAGLHPVTLSYWKHGVNAPRWDGLEHLAAALGYEIVLRPLSVSSADTGRTADDTAE